MRRPSRLFWITVPLAACALALGCAASEPGRWLAPVVQEPTQLVTPGKFVWVDLATSQVAQARTFYGELFGWTFDGRDDDYVRVLQDGTPIGGIAFIDPERMRNSPSAWVENLSVADVDRAVDQLTAAGGVLLQGPDDAPGRGRVALVHDPQGAVLLLVRSTAGDPPDAEPALRRWLWRELWTRDAEAAVAFYTELGGYEREIVDFRGTSYHVLRHGKQPRAGILAAPEGVDPLWLPYVRVADAQAVAKRAQALGARIVEQDEEAAILVDPVGAAFGVQRWDGPRSEESR